MNRGEVYWVDLDPTKGSEISKLRPCVIVSANAINRARRTVIVVPLSTSAQPRPPLVIPISCMDKPSVAVCDQIRTVDKTRLRKQAGKFSIKEIMDLEDSLKQILSL